MTDQWTEYQFAHATDEERVQAHAGGNLQAILDGTALPGGPSDLNRDEGQKSEAWLKTASPEDIAAAHRAGQLRNVMEGRTDDVIAAEQAAEAQRAAERNAFANMARVREVLSSVGIPVPDDWGTK
jgi:hypothetical protein